MAYAVQLQSAATLHHHQQQLQLQQQEQGHLDQDPQGHLHPHPSYTTKTLSMINNNDIEGGGGSIVTISQQRPVFSQSRSAENLLSSTRDRPYDHIASAEQIDNNDGENLYEPMQDFVRTARERRSDSGILLNSQDNFCEQDVSGNYDLVSKRLLYAYILPFPFCHKKM